MEWPIHLYKEGAMPRYAHNKKELETIKRDGFSEQKIAQDWPKTGYRPHHRPTQFASPEAFDETNAKLADSKQSPWSFTPIHPDQWEPAKPENSQVSPEVEALKAQIAEQNKKIDLLIALSAQSKTASDEDAA